MSLPQPLPVSAAEGDDWNWNISSPAVGARTLGAQWMVEQGARHLVLLGRRGASAAAVSAIKAMEESGASILIASADVSREAELAVVFAQVEDSMPPLRGIVHAAAVLDDGILLQQDAQRSRAVLAPKVTGTWNLHVLTAGKPLDFFVMFSSVASFLASAGTGNYAAANSFLDAFADFRRSLGLPATTINWGGWAEMGLAAGQPERLERLSERGLKNFSEAEGLAALDTLLRWQPARVAAIRFDAQVWCAAPDLATPTSLFTHLLGEPRTEVESSGDTVAEELNLKDSLLTVDPGPRRRSFLEAHLQEQIARVLRLAPSRIDTKKPFRTMGLDSLMGLELRNRLEAQAGMAIPATLIWNYPTVTGLAAQLAARLGVALEAEQSVPPAHEAAEAAAQENDAELAGLLSEIEELSEDDARRLLVE